jgi:hypothetical protein
MIHGDAYPENLIHTRNQVVLSAWDSVSYGPREQDIVPASIRYRFGHPKAEWDQFRAAYGVHPADLPGLIVLRQMRELRTLGPYIRTTGRSPAQAEVSRRIARSAHGNRAEDQLRHKPDRQEGLDQFGGSVRLDDQHPRRSVGAGNSAPQQRVRQHGTAVPNVRVVTPGKLEELKLALKAYAAALADGQGCWGDKQAVGSHLARHKLDAGPWFWRPDSRGCGI